MFSRQAAASGKTAAIRSSASIRCSCGGTFLPPRLRGTASEIVVFQRQRVWNTGASRNAWIEHVARGRRMQIAEDVGERERVLRPEREQQRVFGGRGLQLEVELTAEPLAQREAPRLVHAAAERRVQHELHAARLVEEALEDERVLRRQHAERGASGGEIGDDLFGGAGGIPVSSTSQSTTVRLKPDATTGVRSVRLQATLVRIGRSAAFRRTSTSARRSLTARDSSSLRAGASPSQNGIVGGAPLASATRTTPVPTCSTRHEALPS